MGEVRLPRLWKLGGVRGWSGILSCQQYLPYAFLPKTIMVLSLFICDNWRALNGACCSAAVHTCVWRQRLLAT